MLNRLLGFLILCSIVTLFYSCQKEDYQDQNEGDLITNTRNSTGDVPLVDNAKLAYETYNRLSSIDNIITNSIGNINWDENIFYTTDVEKSKGVLYFPIISDNIDIVKGLIIFSKTESMSKFNMDIVSRKDVVKALEEKDRSSRINLLNETIILNAFDKTIFNRNKGDLLRFPNDEPEGGPNSTFENDCGCIISPVDMTNVEEGEESEEGEGDENGEYDDNYTEPDGLDGWGNGKTGGGTGGGSGGGSGGDGEGIGSWGASGSWGGTGITVDGWGNTGGGSPDEENTDDENTESPDNTGGGSSGGGTSGGGTSGGNPWYEFLLWLDALAAGVQIEEEAKGGEESLIYVTISCSDSDAFGASDEIASINVEAALTTAQDLRLECDQYDCLFTNAEMLDEIQNLIDDTYFTCSDESKENIIRNIIDELCSENVNKPWVRLDILEEELKGLDKVTPYFDDPRLACIYEKLLLGSDNIFCSTFENFLGETDIDLTLSNSNQSTALAITTPYFLTEGSPQGNTINISFNENQLADYCEVVVVGTFLHEGLHAEMFRLLNDPTIDINDVGSVWANYDEHVSQHNNMADEYISLLMSSLKQRYGNKYTDDQYEAIAWHGLGNVGGENVNTTAWNALTDAKKLSLTAQFQSVNTSCATDECK